MFEGTGHFFKAEMLSGSVSTPLSLTLWPKYCTWVLNNSHLGRGWSGGAMVLGKLPVPGRLTIWILVGQGPTALAVGAGGGCLDNFSLVYHFSFLTPSLWETAGYGLKYCLKGPLSPNQPTNQHLVPLSFKPWRSSCLNTF